MPLRLRSALVRGLLAGLVAGVLAGGVGFWTGEALIDQAIALENTETTDHHHTAGSTTEPHDHKHSDEEVLIPRDVQRAGLVLATALTGAATGMIFASIWFLKSRRSRLDQPLDGIMPLAVSGWVAVAAVPWLVIPPNPPALGSSDSIDYRTGLWLLAVLLGLAALIIWFVLKKWIDSRTGQSSAVSNGIPVLAAIAIVLLGWQMLPASSVDYAGFPGDLLWNFRLASAATQLTLWLSMGLVFQFLMERSARKSARL